jgi:ribosomal protein L11 methylase PrmA
MSEFKSSSFEVHFDGGSFRDPAGRVFMAGGRVFRGLTKSAGRNFECLSKSGCYERLIAEGILLPAKKLSPEEALVFAQLNVEQILEHEKINHISYAYEWPFTLLKRAAIAHLDLHLSCLKDGFNLIDGNAYNIQFVGVNPKFIDTPSIVPYQDGDIWMGYAQFCEQFIAPLLLTADLGIPFHSWLRGSPNGIPLDQLSALLPLRKRLRFSRFIHIVLHSRLRTKYSTYDKNVRRDGRVSKAMTKKKLTNFVLSLKHMISGLQVKQSNKTEWENYETFGHYGGPDHEKKKAFVASAVEGYKPHILWDMGCNAGQFAEIALASGAKSVVGFDTDLGALEIAVKRATEKSLEFLPLHLDILNPSPNLGWAERERAGINNRSSADMVVALAVIHHIVISGNIPLQQAVEWIVDRAKSGVIEFVTKKDPMVRKLLVNREDHFDDYNVQAFESYLSRAARIVNTQTIQNGDRILYSFDKMSGASSNHG